MNGDDVLGIRYSNGAIDFSGALVGDVLGSLHEGGAFKSVDFPFSRRNSDGMAPDSLQGKKLDPVQHLSRLYRLTQEIQVADAGAHVGTELPRKQDARKWLAEALPTRGLTKQIE